MFGSDFSPLSKTTIQNGGEDKSNFNDFFNPLNEMDPLVRKEKKIEFKFDCGFFRMDMESERDEYKNIINRCMEGEYIQGVKQTHFTKDGDLLIYLEWIVKVSTEKEKATDPLEELNIQKEETPWEAYKKTTKKVKKEKKEVNPVEENMDQDQPTSDYGDDPIDSPTLPFDLEEDLSRGLPSIGEGLGDLSDTDNSEESED